MITTDKAKPLFRLLAKQDGKEVEVARFATDFLAINYAKDYRLEDWRIEGPKVKK